MRPSDVIPPAANASVDLRVTHSPVPMPVPSACDYCPSEHKRPPYRMVEAVDVDAWGRRVFHAQRYICAACEIRAWDAILNPSGPALPGADRVRTLEEQVADLREQLRHLAARSPRGGCDDG